MQQQSNVCSYRRQCGRLLLELVFFANTTTQYLTGNTFHMICLLK